MQQLVFSLTFCVNKPLLEKKEKKIKKRVDKRRQGEYN